MHYVNGRKGSLAACQKPTTWMKTIGSKAAAEREFSATKIWMAAFASTAGIQFVGKTLRRRAQNGQKQPN